MLYVSQLHHLNRLSTLDRIEIAKYRDALSAKQPEFQTEIEEWLKQHDLHCDDSQTILLDSYFSSLTATELDDAFYVVQYHQALYWLNCGMSQNNILLLLNKIQKQFILYSEEFGSPTLGTSLAHYLEVGVSIVTTVFQLSRTVDQMKTRCQNEIRRLQNTYGLLNVPLPEEVFKAYVDHQKWKSMVFELALGRKVDLTRFEVSHLRCDLAKWLDAGGIDKIPEPYREGFDKAHEMVHRLGLLAIEESRNNSPEGIVELLFEMEKNSEEVVEVLLGVLERELMMNSDTRSVKGFLDKNLIHTELDKFIAFARRHDFWLDLVVLEIDDYANLEKDQGDWAETTLVTSVAGIIQDVARTEDLLFQVEDHKFMIMAMGREVNGAEVLAERVRERVTKMSFANVNHQTIHVTLSCGVVSYWAGLRIPMNEPLDLLEKQLQQAQKNGGNQVQHMIVDVVSPITHDIVDTYEQEMSEN